MKTIASNAGVEGAVIVGKVLEMAEPQMGYNAATGEFVDMIKGGIIDPLKVCVRVCLCWGAAARVGVVQSQLNQGARVGVTKGLQCIPRQTTRCVIVVGPWG